MFKRLRADINAAKRNDPAARNKFEIWLTYSGVHALSWHRWANRLYRMHLKLLARITSQFAKFLTGIEIHPAAKIEGGVFIDHGMGVVIGETAEVKSGVVIYQGVTLGGTGKEKGKRHPTIEKDVVISSGAKVLGGFTVGEGAKIGAGAVVLKEVPPHATVVGVPGRVVRIRGEKPDLLQEKVDPNAEEIRALKCRVHKLEAALQKLTGETFECSEEELFPVSAPFPEEKIPVTEAEPIAEAPADGGPPETGEEKPAADEIADKAADEKAGEKREENDEKESKEE